MKKASFLSKVLLAVAVAVITQLAQAANDLWVGNTDANFATLANWTGSVNPSGNTPQFGVAGSSGTTLNNDLTGASFTGLTFNSGASAFTIGGNSFTLTGNITNSSSSLQTINNNMTLATGNRTLAGGAGGLTLGGTSTQTQTTASAGLIITGTVNSTGSFTEDGGATSNAGYLSLGGAQTLNVTSGTFSVLGTTNATKPLSTVGQNVAGTSNLNVSGGNLVIGSETGFALANGSTGTGVLTISSGTATINRGTLATTTNTVDTRLIEMGKDGANTGIINLNGGTLATGRQFVSDGSSSAGAGTANFVFGGGTLKALGTQTDWLQSTTATSAGQNQGATGGTVNANALALSSVTTTAVSTIDANGFSVAINSAISGAGGFNINSSTGTGVVTFGGVNTYTGTTTLTSGTLKLTGALSTSGTVSLGSATLLGSGTAGALVVNSTSGVIANGNGDTSSLTLGSLTFNNAGTLNLNKANDTTTVALAITGTLTTTSGITLNIPTAPTWANGSTYNLISYGGFSGTNSNFILGTISGLGARQSATLGNTGAGSGFITLAIAGDTPFWTGAQNNTWTTGTSASAYNWKLITAQTPTYFLNNDQVFFDDNATGSTTVNISGSSVGVVSVTFNNNTKDYTIASSSGAGIKDGSSAGTLTKTGSATVTLAATNSYTGVTTINNGVLQLGDGTTNGDIATSSGIVNNASLVFNRTAGSTFTYANAISGTGAVMLNGAGTQILIGSNSYNGVTTISSGTLQIGNGGTTGSLSGGGAITDNSSLVFNRSNTITQGTDFGTISGTGSVMLTGAGKVVLLNANDFSGGTTISSGTLQVGNGGTTGSLSSASAITNNSSLVFNRLDTVVQSIDFGTISGTGSVTQSGAGTVILSNSNSYSGSTNLNSGTISVGDNNALGTGTVTMSGGTLTNTTNVSLANNFTLNSNPIFTAGNGDMTLNGNITGTSASSWSLNPTNKITLGGSNSVTFAGNFAGMLVNAGTGGVDITGTTTINGALANQQSGYLGVAGNTALTIQPGGTFSVLGTTNATKPLSTVGQNVAGTSNLNVSGGNLVIGTETGFALGNGSTGTGVLTISSGTATINRGTLATTTNGVDTRLILMGRDPSSANGNTGIINLNGGTLATDRQFVRDGSIGTGSANSGIANFVFGGGTLKALGTQTDWLQSTTASSAGQNQGATGGTVNTGALALSSVTTTGTSTIDANSFSVAINSAISGAGGFNINSSTGTGVVTFGGTNTYTGGTTVTSGTLAFAVSETLIGGLNVETSGTAVLTAHTGGAANVKVLDLSALTISGTTPFIGDGGKDFGGLASPAPVPEPGTIGLLAIGAIGGLLLRRRSRKSSIIG